MRRALAESETGVIAEFKRRSPSKGWLHEDAKVEAVVPAYETGGASACSVLTDGEFFGGTLEDLKQARRLVRLPLLRKDFVVDEYQLYQARAEGAAAVLLIAAVLSPDECRRFARTAHELELEVLLEVHTPSELSRLNGYVDMLGVNNRDLGTFHTDVENSFRMADRLRREVGGGEGPLLVSESGISDPETVVRLREAGFTSYHHNLETSASHFPSICTTHAYEQDLETVRVARTAGFRVCSCGIFGLGETWEQRIELSQTLTDLGVDSLPLNFLNPIPGTPLGDSPLLPPSEALRVVALMRLLHPEQDVLICGGRSKTFGQWQSWVFAAGANGVMTGNYLTTKGCAFCDDAEMYEVLGLREERS